MRLDVGVAGLVRGAHHAASLVRVVAHSHTAHVGHLAVAQRAEQTPEVLGIVQGQATQEHVAVLHQLRLDHLLERGCNKRRERQRYHDTGDRAERPLPAHCSSSRGYCSLSAQSTEFSSCG